ncbi:alpha/beta hydrolase [Paraburkholderia sp.]|uniref:alpha/beta fold hydrolase n=1 Tax=Paraburkholderia sp. TaxID=1926495 RepID=UPI00238465D9|nr:alpha/beta hydrolase [Paraburkholderia sp.]MDE1179695.1 alpha/beta hydrolase [Paraburkholderia sp.]
MSAWILLRGLTRESRHWGKFPAALQAAMPGSRVLRIDLPGNGTLSHARAPSTVAAMVDAVRRAASQRGERGPYRVVAMSLGGMVATAWAQRYPAELAQLVLINTSMRPFSSAVERLRPGAWPGLLDIARHWRDDDENAAAAEATIHRLTCNARDTLTADLALWREIRRSAPVTRANALRQLWAAACFRAASGAPSCASLVLSSRADRLVNPRCSAALAAAWKVPLREHPWAGHDLPHDDPSWTAETIRAMCDCT